MVAAEIVVPFEIAVVISHVPVAVGLQAVDEAAVVEHGQVEPASVPGDQLRTIFLYAVEEALYEFGFGIRRAPQRPYAEFILVAQRTGNRHYSLQVQGKKIASDRLATRLKRHLGDVDGWKPVGKIVESAQSLCIGNSLDVENQYGSHARRSNKSCASVFECAWQADFTS